MVSKKELISLSVLIQLFALIKPTRLINAKHNPGGKLSIDYQNEDLKSDPNYEALMSLHAANPESYPPETWRDLLAELSFGPSLKERLRLKAEAQDKSNLDLPAEFDARKKWKKCKRLIGTVYDQGPCIADYAITAASVLADRLCIKKKGRFRSLLSAQKLLGCYGSCQGGYIYPAFQYLNNSGVPTGGLQKQRKGCIPFEPPPCHHWAAQKPPKGVKIETDVSMPNCSSLIPVNYTCPTTCTNMQYDKDMEEDLHLSSSMYWILFDEGKIRREIMEKGPVGTVFYLYDDFRKYRSGVYEKSPDAKYEGYMHKVKIIGWGTEHGKDYWLGVNSYGKNWGLKGLFKFPRGEDYLEIQSFMIGVEPRD